MQKLMKHGFMTAMELTACHLLEDHVFPAPADGYVVFFVSFYKWGFDTPSHQFLRSLLQYYDLELHHFTPLGILHIASFKILCEAYLGVDPEFDLRNYFFCVRHLQDLKARLTVSGGAVIHVKYGHGVDPYLGIPMPRSMKGW
jgi:hypothetical protein